jgi:hypothetical protein
MILRLLAAAGLVLACSACGHDSSAVSETPVGNPYDGPLVLDTRGGAAREVVACDAPVAGGGNNTDGYDDGEAYDSAEEALSESADGFVFDGVDEGFRAARVEDDRVLYTYDVDGATKQAVIVHDGPTVGDEGWYVESWARCDLAELPASTAEGMGVELWSDAAGLPVDTRKVQSYPGPDHCDWQRATFLQLGRSTYVRNPPEDLVGHSLAEDWSADTRLPGDATDTGYRRGEGELWVSGDGGRAYLVTGHRVEMWPRETEPVGCA